MSKLKYFDGTNWNEVGGKIAGDTLPIGAIVPFGGWDAPTGWLICDGTLLNKTDYPELYNAIGYSFGGEEGGSTFGLPDLRGRVPLGLKETDTDFNGMGLTGGEKTHTLTINEIPSHKHDRVRLVEGNQFLGRAGGSNSNVAGLTLNNGQYPYDNTTYNNADTSNTGGDQPHNNLQPYQTVNYIIKAKQSAGVVANVSNTYSASQTDTYSCDYANNTFQNKPTILFTGNTTGQVLLSQSAANFTYLEIFYQGADNFNSTKLYNPNGKTAYLITGWMANNTTGNVKLARVSISGTTISKTNYTSLNYDSNYANASEENGISITTVIGYK